MPSYLTERPITVEIRNGHGEVHVELIDTDTTTVTVTAVAGHPFGFLDDLLTSLPTSRRRASSRPADGAAAADAVRIDYELIPGDGGLLLVDTQPTVQNWRAAFAVAITAPSGSGVRVQGQSAEVTVTGTAGLVDLRTTSGDVTVATVTGTSRVHSASGDIRLGRADADVDLRTASGDVNVGRVAGKAKVHSTSGDIALDFPAGDIDVRSVSGDVRIGAASTGVAQIAAVTGDVEIGVTAGRRAAIDLSTISGDTRTDFAVSTDPAVDFDEPEADAPFSISVRTTSGDIRLCRAA